MSLILLSELGEPFTARDIAGRVLPFATLDFFIAGTSSPADSLEDGGHFEADVDGVFPEIELETGIAYRVVHKTAAGVLVYDVDPYVCTCGVDDRVFRSPIQRALDGDGRIAPGALLYSFEDDAETPQDLFADPELTTPLPNPYQANAAGVFPSAIYADDEAEYVLVLRDRNGNLLEEFDPYECACGAGSPVTTLVSFTGDDTWEVPAGVTEIDILCVGGGGGGCSLDAFSTGPGGGGGGGGVTVEIGVTVTPLDTLAITVGDAGLGGTNDGDATPGAASTVIDGSLATLCAAGGGGANGNDGEAPNGNGCGGCSSSGPGAGAPPSGFGGGAWDGVTSTGGGGGAGGAGTAGAGLAAGNGGPGVLPAGDWGVDIGEDGFFGGGGPGRSQTGLVTGDPGIGNGANNTGGGGPAAAGDGWSGFVAIRYTPP